MSQASGPNEDPRLAEILDVIFKFAAGDLTARGSLSNDDGSLDGVMAGINILGEELQAYVAENNLANESLRRALDLAQALIRSSPDGILAIDRELRITEWNLLMEHMSGVSVDQAYGRVLDEIPFMNETGQAARVRNGIDETSVAPTEIAYDVPGTGEVRFFESIMAPLPGNGAQMQGVVLRVSDITERKRTEQRLRSTSLYVRSLIEASLDPLMTISIDGTIMDANGAASRATGVPLELLIGTEFSAYFTVPAAARVAYQDAFSNGTITNVPLTMTHVSGTTTEVLYNASLYHDEKGEVAGALAVARDVTERRRAERAEDLASRDSLTGLYNHRTFYSLLHDEFVRTKRFRRPVSLFMLDIDHFKQVNDTLGHQAGDAIIHGLSALLVDEARAVDRVCRYGGEEFTLILPETGATMAMKIAERLRAQVESRRFDIGEGSTAGITVSIGVATYPQQVKTVDELVKAADTAMYAAKASGRNRTSRYAANVGEGSGSA